MLILDNSPIQMSNRTDKALFEKLETGDKILVLHDGIAESYPGRTGAYAVFKLEEGSIDDISQDVLEQLREMGWLSNVRTYAFTIAGEALDVAVAYANWTDDEKIYNSALNADKILADSAHHYPIYKFDTVEDLEQFKCSFGDVLTMVQLCINVKVDPEWRDLWRSTYESVLPGYHQNKEHWNTVILDGTVPDEVQYAKALDII